MKDKHPRLYGFLRWSVVLFLFILVGFTIYHQSTGGLVSPEAIFARIMSVGQSAVSAARQATSIQAH